MRYAMLGLTLTALTGATYADDAEDVDGDNLNPISCFGGGLTLGDDRDSCASFVLGTVQSLEGNGSFKGGGEASVLAVTAFIGGSEPDSDQPFSSYLSKSRLNGFFEVTVSELGRLDETMAPSNADSAESKGGEDPVFNPFSSSGTFFRTNVGLEWMPSRNVGLQLGAGYSTRPGEGTTLSDVSRRTFGGLLFRGDFGDRVSGYAMLGVSEDDFWTYDSVDSEGNPVTSRESDRYIFDGRLNFPNTFSTSAVQFSLRLFSDLPRSGNGPSDIRVSILADVPFGRVNQ